jgi:2-polyprenyl-3-methyl-5-hydroxy-6-metoxy-1,4-benzoquinol methylase
VLIPTLIKLIGDVRGIKVLDVGCGSGVLCSKLANLGAHVDGVDLSEEMIRIAQRESGALPNVKFHNADIVDYAKQSGTEKFSVCVSNMSLITMPNLDESLLAISSLLEPKGIFAFNITHPCFWNNYRQFDPVESFDYTKEHAQQGQFLISLDRAVTFSTTHFHRPLSSYFRALSKANFVVQELMEPMPKPEDEIIYPSPWRFPRFLSIKATHRVSN